MKSPLSLAAILLLLFIIACNRNSDSKQTLPELSSDKISASETGKPEYDQSDSAAIPDQKQKESAPVNKPKTEWDKKIIKTATLELEVKDGNMFYKNLREQVKSFGGYIAQENQLESDYKLENQLVIKVPVDQFDLAVAGLSDKVEKIHQRSISSEDVTGQIVDTRSRLEAKKQVRLRYLELLKQAHNMTDILSVQSEINGIQEEIEAATGRVQWLGNAAAYSTINLTYFQVLNEKAKEDPLSFGSRLLSSFRTGAQWLLELLVGLVTVWPLLAIGIIAAVFGKRILRKKKAAV